MNIYEEIDLIIKGIKYPQGIPTSSGGRDYIQKFREFTSFHTLHAHLIGLDLKPQIFQNKKFTLVQAQLFDNDFANFVYVRSGHSIDAVFITSNTPVRWLFKKHLWTGWLDTYPTELYIP